MTALGSGLTRQAGDQVGILREGPAGVFREGYAVLGDDTTTPLADIAALTDADRGLSLGEVDIPTTRALTIAETNLPNSNRVAVPLRDMQAIYTNAAAEPTARGAMNTNGKPGYASWSNTVLVNGATQTVDTNGELYRVVGATSGQTFQIAPGSYNGHRMNILFSPTAATQPGCEVRLYSPLPNSFSGVFRNRDHRVWGHTTSAAEYLILREAEYVELIWQSGAWTVANQNFAMYAEANWYETDQARAEVRRVAAPAGVQIMPVAMTSANYAVTTSNGAVVSAKTPTSFTVSAACDWHLTGGEIDYVALGGIASF